MSKEWLKTTIADLITTYKENENLYNPKHKLYTHKQARGKSMLNILQVVQKTKPDATVNDVAKKIQVLRTQFGQELNKIEKSKSLGEELTYVPKIWWFKNLQFIKNFMKTRSSQSTPLSIKAEQKSLNETSCDSNLEETLYEVVETNDEELENEDLENVKKKRRLEISENDNSIQSGTIEYIINEELIPPVNNHNDLLEIDSPKIIDHKKFKRKSKAFGEYVGCLMRELTDDKLFCEVQNEILKIIEKATLANSSK